MPSGVSGIIMGGAKRPVTVFAFLLASPLGPATYPTDGLVLNAARYPTFRRTGSASFGSQRGQYSGEVSISRWQPQQQQDGNTGLALAMRCSSGRYGSRRGRGRGGWAMKASTALDGYVDAQGLPPEGQEDAHDDGGHGGDDGVKFKRHKRAVHRVIFMRHGECEWNRDNRFLGWADIGLTEKGEEESKKAAKTLAEFGITVDEMFCSYLKRSIKSAWILAGAMDQAWMPIHTDWRLNEQMYGALQGLNKRATAERFGTKLTQQWRRSYDIAPPAKPGGVGYFPVGDPKYAALTEDDIPASWCGSPNTESLKDAQARSWLFWRERVVPALRDGKTVLICGHGNIIRSMLKRLDDIPNGVLKQVSIPRGTPLVYELDNDFVPVSTPGSLGPLRGRFLCNPVDLARALQQESIAAQLGPMAGTGSVAHGEGAIERVERALGNV